MLYTVFLLYYLNKGYILMVLTVVFTMGKKEPVHPDYIFSDYALLIAL